MNGTARAHLERLLGNTELRAKLYKLSDEAGVPLTPQAVTEWRYLQKGVPPTRVPMVAKVLRVPPHELRPDLPHLFPPPRTKRASKRR